MNRKPATWLIVFIVLIFLSYIVYDVAFNKEKPVKEIKSINTGEFSDKWIISGTIDPASGKIKAVSIMPNGNVLIGGDSFLACYDPLSKLLWNRKTDKPVTALSVSDDTIFAATIETIRELNNDGEQITEWGPFEDSSLITSVASNKSYIVFADAGNKIIMVLDKKGSLKLMIGKSGESFVIPSQYFDVAIDGDNNIYAANTGRRSVNKIDMTGRTLGSFGQAGMAPDAFCGCCNPAHFALIPGGFVTAEKGLNRIKILNSNGEFIEFVSSVNAFVRSIPLDVASFDGKIIYGANPADNKVYIFTRK